MIQFIIALTILMLLFIFATFAFTKNRKLTVNQIILEVFSVLFAIGGYAALIKWNGFKFDYWATIGVMLGLIVIAWNFANYVEKQKFKLVELILLTILPILFYPIYGINLATNLLIGVFPVVISYVVLLLLIQYVYPRFTNEKHVKNAEDNKSEIKPENNKTSKIIEAEIVKNPKSKNKKKKK